MSEQDRPGLLKGLGKVGGVFAGAVVGMDAGKELGHAVEPNLGGALHDHASLITDSLSAAGGFGCAYAGYLLAARKPEQALLIGAATIAAGKLAALETHIGPETSSHGQVAGMTDDPHHVAGGAHGHAAAGIHDHLHSHHGLGGLGVSDAAAIDPASGLMVIG
jgi:hypothetical protein